MAPPPPALLPPLSPLPPRDQRCNTLLAPAGLLPTAGWDDQNSNYSAQQLTLRLSAINPQTLGNAIVKVAAATSVLWKANAHKAHQMLWANRAQPRQPSRLVAP